MAGRTLAKPSAPAPGASTYQVLDPLRHDGEDYPVGAWVTLAPDAAAPLLALAVIAASGERQG